EVGSEAEIDRLLGIEAVGTRREYPREGEHRREPVAVHGGGSEEVQQRPLVAPQMRDPAEQLPVGHREVELLVVLTWFVRRCKDEQREAEDEEPARAEQGDPAEVLPVLCG